MIIMNYIINNFFKEILSSHLKSFFKNPERIFLIIVAAFILYQNLDLERKYLLINKQKNVIKNSILIKCNNGTNESCYMTSAIIRPQSLFNNSLTMADIISMRYCQYIEHRGQECIDRSDNPMYLTPLVADSSLVEKISSNKPPCEIMDSAYLMKVAGGNIKDYLQSLNVAMDRWTICVDNKNVIMLGQRQGHVAEGPLACVDSNCFEEMKGLNEMLKVF